MLAKAHIVSGGTVLASSVCNGVAWICCEEEQRWKLCQGALTVDFAAGCSAAAAR